jgi:hypothetical protein
MIDFRAIIDTNDIYKHPETRIEYALLQKPYISANIEYKDICVYEAAAIDSYGNEIKLEWHDNPYADLGVNEATDFDLFNWDNFKVIEC